MNHIETQRLILRHFTEEDINALFSILSDKDVNTFLPMFPLKDIEEAKDYLQYIKSWIQQKGFYYAICMKTNNVNILVISRKVNRFRLLNAILSGTIDSKRVNYPLK